MGTPNLIAISNMRNKKRKDSRERELCVKLMTWRWGKWKYYFSTSGKCSDEVYLLMLSF